MLATRNDMIRGTPRVKRPGRRSMTSPARDDRAHGRRMRCLPGSHGRRWSSPLNSSVAAAVLAVPLLVLPAAPAGAAGETSKGINHWEVEFPSASWKKGEGLSTSRFRTRDSQVTMGGLRIGLWPSHEEEEPAGVANIDAGRWRGWTGDSFAHVADDGSIRTGSQGMDHPDLLLGSWFRLTAGDSAAPGGHGSGWGHVALMRLTRPPGRPGKGLACPFGVDCERARLLAGPAPSYRIGKGGFSVSGRYGLGFSLKDVHPYVRVTLTRRLSVRWTYRF